MADLRRGDDSAIERLMALWAVDGSLQVRGAPRARDWPKDYRGAKEIRSRFLKMAKASTSGVTVRGARVRVDVVTVLDSVVVRGRKAVATISSTIRTDEGRSRGFDMRKHKFTFEFSGAQLQSVVEDVDWSGASKSDITGVRLSDLNVTDIGKLTLAAWAIA